MSKGTPKKNDSSKEKKAKSKVELPKHLKHINRFAAGIDIGSTSHYSVNSTAQESVI